MKKYLLCCAAFFLTVILFAQQSPVKWKASIETRKVFIENKGQFIGGDQLPDSKILFGTDEGPCMIYFTNNGLTYRLDKREVERDNKEAEREEGKSALTREEDEHRVKVTTDVVHMEWIGADPNAQIVAMQPAHDYYSYSVNDKNINHAQAYGKLVYKNLYPNIDVEYVFHPQDGIKYSLILHPGADVSQVKMIYSGI